MDEKSYFGVMLDVSRNGVIRVEKLKKFVDYLSLFGYNSLFLYTEDTYEVESEPYFGYMRGRYTAKEIKEIDAYCQSKGIELIPCIQTLAHLNQIFRWEEYRNVWDVEDILLVDEEKTYQLIEKFIATVSKLFSSKLVHIGMDEAHMLGLGKRLDKYGYENKSEILQRHLKKVCSIVDKYGCKPMIWSDMFCRNVNGGEYYGDHIVIPQEVVEDVPKNLELVYWDYYHTKEKDFTAMIKTHKAFKNPAWFAGGAWSWLGFVPSNFYSIKTMKPAMTACRKNNIRNVMITLWGDGGKECSTFSVLPSLYYVKCIYDGKTSLKQIKAGFKALTGESFDVLKKLDMPNLIAGNKDINANPSKYVLYNDLFNGFLDTTLPDGGNEDYVRIAKSLRRAKRQSSFKDLFEMEARLCDVLSIKYDLGIQLRKAYQENDKEKLAALVAEIRKTETKLKAFYKIYKKVWLTENKPFGFEIQDIRFGALQGRLQSCRERIMDFLNGKETEIPELKEELLDYENGGKRLLLWVSWQKLVSPNIL